MPMCHWFLHSPTYFMFFPEFKSWDIQLLPFVDLINDMNTILTIEI